ncbi:hypothetical protein AO284_13915 [Pseudomonas sp. NZIPFR-PS2]|nr:hypothetical protein AO284_13915 [Pseudomonas sp. NZIPFR-PS2]
MELGARTGSRRAASVFLIAQNIARRAINTRFIDCAVGLAPFDFPIAIVIGFGRVNLDITGLGLGDFNSLFNGNPDF